MTIGEAQRMKSNDIQKLYECLPEPYYPMSINTDPDPMEKILRDFIARKPSEKERKTLQEDFTALAKLGRVPRE